MDLVLTRGPLTLPLADFRLGISRGADGSPTRASIEAILDVRDLTGWLPGPLAAADVCALSDGGCTPCGSDGDRRCVPVAIHDVPLESLGEHWLPVSVARCHPDCDESWANASCETSGF